MAINAKFVLALEQPSGPTPSTPPPASEPITAKMNPSADPAIRIQATFRIVLTPSSESVALPNESRFSCGRRWHRPCPRSGSAGRVTKTSARPQATQLQPAVCPRPDGCKRQLDRRRASWTAITYRTCNGTKPLSLLRSTGAFPLTVPSTLPRATRAAVSCVLTSATPATHSFATASAVSWPILPSRILLHACLLSTTTHI